VRTGTQDSACCCDFLSSRTGSRVDSLCFNWHCTHAQATSIMGSSQRRRHGGVHTFALPKNLRSTGDWTKKNHAVAPQTNPAVSIASSRPATASPDIIVVLVRSSGTPTFEMIGLFDVRKRETHTPHGVFLHLLIVKQFPHKLQSQCHRSDLV
jgi:hypothetical protein